MSRPVKDLRRAETPEDVDAVSEDRAPRRTGRPKVVKSPGTAHLGAGKYLKRHERGKGDVIIWKDLPQK